jgi:hypothetical protein
MPARDVLTIERVQKLSARVKAHMLAYFALENQSEASTNAETTILDGIYGSIWRLLYGTLEGSMGGSMRITIWYS